MRKNPDSFYDITYKEKLDNARKYCKYFNLYLNEKEKYFIGYIYGSEISKNNLSLINLNNSRVKFFNIFGQGTFKVKILIKDFYLLPFSSLRFKFYFAKNIKPV